MATYSNVENLRGGAGDFESSSVTKPTPVPSYEVKFRIGLATAILSS